MRESLRERVVLITGATGIAAATEELAVRGGARIFIASIDEEECHRLAGDLRDAGAEVFFRAGDLTVEREAVAAVEDCLARFRRIDGIFNVVGISGRRFGDGPVDECSLEGWQRTMRTNAETTFLMCREAVRAMLGQVPGPSGQRGSILNMSSVLARSPEPERFATHAYAASKGAIESLTISMAAYYASRGIRVNALAPGLVRTPMSRRAQADPAILELMATKQPLCGDLIEAVEVARAALFLLSDDSRMITGEVMTIDAGWRYGSP